MMERQESKELSMVLGTFFSNLCNSNPLETLLELTHAADWHSLMQDTVQWWRWAKGREEVTVQGSLCFEGLQRLLGQLDTWRRITALSNAGHGAGQSRRGSSLLSTDSILSTAAATGPEGPSAATPLCQLPASSGGHGGQE